MVVTGGIRGQAALGTRLAADIYGATVVREGVQDRNDNVTRFVWLAGTGRTDDPPLKTSTVTPPPGGWKTSVVFWGSGADSPGWLVRCLDVFAQRAINLTKIESRPQRARMGHYMFFVDLQGSAREPTVGEALEGLRAACEQVRVLGSYPADANPSG
jgi:prephenate dehydratase